MRDAFAAGHERRPACHRGSAPRQSDDCRNLETHCRLLEFVSRLKEDWRWHDLPELAYLCDLDMTAADIAGPVGVNGRLILLEPNDGACPEDTLGMVIIREGKRPSAATLFTRTREE